MKKQIGQKIIIIVSLIFISAQLFYPATINAEVKLNWNNPNQGKNPYKFKLSDYLNSQMAMQVVGCTGIVNKVSGTLASLMSGDVSSIKWIWASKKQKALEQICLATSLSVMGGLSAIPSIDPESLPETVAEYCAQQKTTNRELEKAAKDALIVEKGNTFREECLNGIAYTLARNQLTAMTKQTMNWVTSGFNGDPMYVRNINNFLSSIEDEIIYHELNSIKNLDGTYNTRDYPYGRDFSASYIRSRQSQQNFAESSKQDLTNYLTDGASIDDFSNDFSKGGWAGWLGLTQHPQNSPLGYTMLASQNIADRMAQEKENTKTELDRSGGFLDQKKCVQYYKISKPSITQYQDVDEDGNLVMKEHIDNIEVDDLENCEKWETVTPGSLIREKVSTYLNSPERQLEMADDINKVLNVLFAKMIDKLRLDGLSSLNSENFNNNSGGIGSNSWTNPIKYIDSNGNKYAGSGLDQSRPFDLIKDLGNIYNRSDVKELGTWDANKNETTPKDGSPKSSLVRGRGVANTYYTVAVSGNTKLFLDGYNGWNVGDRAFFDGENWQNWKKGENSPIAQRGIIQIQQDYIVVAKELQKVMPAVLPALGELDYCIPGPNPNWQINSGQAYDAFSDYVGELEAVYITMESHDNRADIRTPMTKTGSVAFKNYREIFSNSYLPGWSQGWTSWSQVVNSDIISYMEKLDQASGHIWKDDKNTNGTTEANDEVAELKQTIFDSLEVFNKEYPKAMSTIYGTIQQEYLTSEDRVINKERDKNPAYIPMARDGLTLTKKMISYDEEIIEANSDLKESINETDSIINKLELIKNDVGRIIKTAQDRRDGAITKALNEENGENFKTNTAYKTKYAECLNEENIEYLDYTSIIVDEKNRCSDGVDNDFDGLIDEKDSDCGGQTTTDDRGNNSGSSTGRRIELDKNGNRSTIYYSTDANAY